MLRRKMLVVGGKIVNNVRGVRIAALKLNLRKTGLILFFSKRGFKCPL